MLVGVKILYLAPWRVRASKCIGLGRHWCPVVTGEDLELETEVMTPYMIL